MGRGSPHQVVRKGVGRLCFGRKNQNLASTTGGFKGLRLPWIVLASAVAGNHNACRCWTRCLRCPRTTKSFRIPYPFPKKGNSRENSSARKISSRVTIRRTRVVDGRGVSLDSVDLSALLIEWPPLCKVSKRTEWRDPDLGYNGGGDGGTSIPKACRPLEKSNSCTRYQVTGNRLNATSQNLRRSGMPGRRRIVPHDTLLRDKL